MAFYFIFLPTAYISLSIFQGLGKGLYSLILTLISELFLIVLFSYILAISFGMGQQGVWWESSLEILLEAY